MRQTAESLVRKAVDEGRVIAVVGWIPSNHNAFTRKLEKCRSVVFLALKRLTIPKSAGVVLFTRFVSHSVIDQVVRDHNAFNGVFDLGEIRRMLSVIEIPPPPSLLAKGETFVVESLEDVESEVGTPVQQSANFEGFVKEFLNLANKHSSGWVGGKILGKLREQFCISLSAAQLESRGYIVPHIAKGRERIGWYSAGVMMGSPASVPVFPSEVVLDPRLARAQSLLAEEPALHEEKERLLASLKAVEDRLALIELLKEALDTVRAL